MNAPLFCLMWLFSLSEHFDSGGFDVRLANKCKLQALSGFGGRVLWWESKCTWINGIAIHNQRLHILINVRPYLCVSSRCVHPTWWWLIRNSNIASFDNSDTMRHSHTECRFDHRNPHGKLDSQFCQTIALRHAEYLIKGKRVARRAVDNRRINVRFARNCCNGNNDLRLCHLTASNGIHPSIYFSPVSLGLL